jgi:hypothetical protein
MAFSNISQTIEGWTKSDKTSGRIRHTQHELLDSGWYWATSALVLTYSNQIASHTKSQPTHGKSIGPLQ